MLNNTYQADQLQMMQAQDDQRFSSREAHPVVVIVDNDLAVLELMGEALHGEGYTIHSFVGYDLQDAAIQQFCPDLVIIDADPHYANAPVAMVRQLRRTAGLRTTPIVVNSTDRRLLESIMASLDTMACYTFEKPFDIDCFLGLVESIIGSTAHSYELGIN
jgi:DNA-binding response OmpR family regulator